MEARCHHCEALRDKTESLLQYSQLHKKPSFPSLPPSLPSPSNGAIEVMGIHSVADSGRTEELLSSPVIQRPRWACISPPPASHPPSLVIPHLSGGSSLLLRTALISCRLTGKKTYLQI